MPETASGILTPPQPTSSLGGLDYQGGGCCTSGAEDRCTIEVTAQDGVTTRSYTVNVLRADGEANTPATGAPTITGTARIGDTLAALTSGIADEDGLTNATFACQWTSSDGTSDTDIQGATAATYVVAAHDLGNTLKVRVSFSDDAGNDESLTSVGSAVLDSPHMLQANAAEGAITLTWQDPISHVSFGYYHILRYRPELERVDKLAGSAHLVNQPSV